MTHPNALWIDIDVNDYEIFVESVNSNTQSAVYSSSTRQADLIYNFPLSVERIGIIFSHTNFFLGGPFYSESNTTFFIETIRQYHVKHIDFLACDTLKDPLFRDFYAKLHDETGVIVGASDNLTGNIKYGGDWILESTSEDIERVYFTDKIEYYKYVLGFGEFSMVIMSDGTLRATGRNSAGNLADVTTTDRSAYFNITTLQTSKTIIGSFKSKTIKQLSCGRYHTILLMTDNTLWAAGLFPSFEAIPYGQKFTRIPFTSGTIVSIASGERHAIFYTTSNTLWGAGVNDVGQLAISDQPVITVFTELNGITGTIKEIACGSKHSVVLTTSNKLWVTGSNTNGELGLGDYENKFIFMIVNIDTISGRIPQLIAGGDGFTFVTMTDGTIWGTGLQSSIGVNSGSGVGISTFTQASNINNYNGSRTVRKISCGNSHTVILMTDGTLWGTGNGNDGQIGPNGTNLIFSQITIPTTLSSIWCGREHTLLLGTNNILYQAGNNDYGQLGFESPITNMNFVESLSSVSALPDMFVVESIIVSHICFPAGTLVKSDQGHVPIQKLITGKHTLKGKKIVAITETYSMDPDLVCIEKDAIRKNSPSMQTFISTRHKIYDKGKMKAAFRFVGKKGVSFVPYTGEKMYNVLLEEYGTMTVQGLLCETLDPSNPVAKYYVNL